MKGTNQQIPFNSIGGESVLAPSYSASAPEKRTLKVSLAANEQANAAFNHLTEAIDDKMAASPGAKATFLPATFTFIPIEPVIAYRNAGKQQANEIIFSSGHNTTNNSSFFISHLLKSNLTA